MEIEKEPSMEQNDNNVNKQGRVLKENLQKSPLDF